MLSEVEARAPATAETLNPSPSAPTRPTLRREMLDWQTLLKAHALVPVWYWPVLWHYLARLEATAALARAEGRGGFGWELARNGVIRITHWPESETERRARGALPRDFDYTPWTRQAPDTLAFWCAFEAVRGETPPRHRGCTADALSVHRAAPDARAPPISSNLTPGSRVVSEVEPQAGSPPSP
ncbi:MAG: hypothetical protein CME84_04680 [Henriciella sp.]|nr:hypothetical protein [Henriciella sp.]MBF33537.1 hypothetical protein [Hyphomonadaceae bacterium]PHR70181.1 MAG: hypothetical protein COA64_16210 [Henriciella sp.]